MGGMLKIDLLNADWRPLRSLPRIAVELKQHAFTLVQ